jgi:hypothetical protein
MEYKGVEYTLIQTIIPIGWRWRLEYLGHEFAGSSQTRHGAVRAAHQAIDNLLQLNLRVHE